VPNAYGECLIRQARVVLASLAQARDEMRALQTGASGKVKVGALPAMTPGLLPQAIALLKEQSPLTRVIIQEGPMEALLPELRRGAVDLIVGRLPGRAGSEEGMGGADEALDEEVLYRGHNVVVAGPKHPLARRKRVTWPELVRYPWVLPPIGPLSREPLENVLHKHGLSMPADCVETLSIHVITGYLQLTRAVGILSEIVARHYIDSGQLAQLPLTLPDPQRPIGISWSRQYPLSTAAQSFTQCLRDAVKRLEL
jgi:DNA-binding transcriptional LysR family regulator